MAMVTGARRGEICAMRWDLLDFDKSVITIRTSVAQKNSKTWEKDTKAHQQRRIALDETTVAILQGYKQHCVSQAKSVGATLDLKGRIFSPDIRHSQWIKPSTVTQRYRRMCARLGWDMHIHQLRHYSATELISAGVDIRTVASRLGHGGGGTTTLKVYAAWSAEADQRAAANLTTHMPTPPIAFASDGLPKSSTEKDAKHPYEVIAAHLRGAILCDAIKAGETLPTIATIARKHNVANSTVHRAIQILEEAGLVKASRGKRTTVISTVPSDVAPVISLHTKRKA
ncbi:tyrosine-type recombinase/integrase [Actinokineospora sp. PR83]|uniref:tyrosine-type recombinase/integrase n=1 Tax=Actinokineospora sp. PR83 TaxID=2884908 RepID=UPI001F16FC0B|nr:tyrosine-type recombinase/integrase [Actinokineospora sp. PR83]MCG8917381.1 tyrosine-type recombinase/integrase [Actinokineospora sp. PR83]